MILGLLLANFILLVMTLGFFSLVLAGIFGIIWHSHSKKKKKTNILIKLLTILNTAGGFFMFVIPLAGMFLLSGAHEVKDMVKLIAAKDKIYAEKFNNWKEEITLKNGDDLVAVDFLTIPNDAECETKGALVLEKKKFYNIQRVENPKDFDIYTIEHVSKVYVKKDQLEKLKSYYDNEAEYDTYIIIDSGKRQAAKYDHTIINEARAFYDDAEKAFSCDKKYIEETYVLYAYSKDHFYEKRVPLAKYKEDIILREFSQENEITVYSIDDDLVERLSEIIEKAKKEPSSPT